MTDHDDPLADALRALPREQTPPPHVREAVRQAHHRLRRRQIVRRTLPLALAASLILVAFVAGRMTAPSPAPPSGREFAFLLYGGETGGGDPALGDTRAAEYGRWARELSERGVSVSGERLADQAWVAGDPKPANAPVRGFFIVRAPDGAAAVEMARSHPHARVGTIEVRPIDTP
jgi:hypothetical protein